MLESIGAVAEEVINRTATRTMRCGAEEDQEREMMRRRRGRRLLMVRLLFFLLGRLLGWFLCCFLCSFDGFLFFLGCHDFLFYFLLLYTFFPRRTGVGTNTLQLSNSLA